MLLRGTRNRALEPVLLAAGATDFIWAEELSAPLLESQVRHALDARNQAILERRFHEAQKMDTVGRLAGGVAHEFNNILTTIVGFGTLVAEQVAGDASAAGNVAEIMKAAERASVLTRQLLAFGRRQVLRPVRVQLDETVHGVSSLIARLIGEDIDVRITCPPMPPVRADRAQIESALLNLVINARDAMPGGGRLTIETSELTLDEGYCDAHVEVLPGRYVRLAVSDTGNGIPRHVQEQIFEPFFMMKDLPRTNGLGLAAVYGIVKQSGGHILVYSEEGIGTTFKLYLPVDASARDEEEPTGLSRIPPGDGTILVVDDGDGVRRLAGEVIRRAGYEVIEASGPSEALVLAAEYQGAIDLLLTDIVMPGGNGGELARSPDGATARAARALHVGIYRRCSHPQWRADRPGGVHPEALHAARPSAQGQTGPRRV